LEKAAAVNESIKVAENYEKLCQIQKSFITGNVKNLVEETRLFVREGSLTKVSFSFRLLLSSHSFLFFVVIPSSVPHLLHLSSLL
jgi:hypothetical protein